MQAASIPVPATSRSLGNLAGALAIHFVSLVWSIFIVLFMWASSIYANGEDAVSAGEILVIECVVVGLWLGFAGLVVRWWLRGRGKLWNVTLAWLVLISGTLYVLPFLLWPRFRHWLGGSLKPWRPLPPI